MKKQRLDLALVERGLADTRSKAQSLIMARRILVNGAYVGKGGIVRDDAKRTAAVDTVVAAARALGFDVKGVIESPVKGAEGNVEYLMYATTNTPAAPPATTPE